MGLRSFHSVGAFGNSIKAAVAVLLFIGIASFSAVTFIACGNNGSNNGAPAGSPNMVGVPVPLAGDCLQSYSEASPTYQTVWQPYVQYGIHPYHWHGGGQVHAAGGRRGFNTTPFLQQMPNDGLCGCEAQLYPACGPQGMTCVPTTGIPGNYQFSTWNYQNGQFIPGQPVAPQGYAAGSCSNSVAQLCTPGQVNTTAGSYCQPLGNGSPYGIWVQPL